MLKITKFGGSSVATAAQFKKIKDIIRADSARRFVVVSAAGRRFPDDNKVTDLLYLVCAHRAYHVDATDLLEDVEERFLAIKDGLGLTFPVAEKFAEFASHIGSDSEEYIVLRGEWFTAHLMAEYLGLPFVDAADVIVFHHDGTLNEERTDELVRATVKRLGKFCMPGFYGATSDGEIKLMERGGGDITGSLLARALSADLYENWTDVSGFLSADPSLVDEPRTIDRITFDEMRELSYMGASVLHEDAIFPVREANIPIQILNTNDPENTGTIIREHVEHHEGDPVVTGIAGRKDFLSVYVDKTHLSNMVGALRRVLAIFERYGISIEHLPTGIDSFSVVVNAADVKNSIYSIVRDIKEELEPDEVKVIDGLALVSVVGRNMSKRPGTSGKILTTLGDAGINVRMISQSSQEITIIVGVNERDFAETVRRVYDAFVREEV